MPLAEVAVLGRKNIVVCFCRVFSFTLNFSVTGISEDDRGWGRLMA
jgi:hypothetical protein